MTDHATLIAELARLREAAREAEEALELCMKRIEAQALLLVSYRLNKRPTEKVFEAMNDSENASDIAHRALTRLRESLKGAGDER